MVSVRASQNDDDEHSALEGATESLAREINPDWNIKVFTAQYSGVPRLMTLQITLVECGYFATNVMNNSVLFPPHPSYTRVELSSDDDPEDPGDVGGAILRIYELARMRNPPMRLTLGKDAITTLRDRLKGWEDGLNRYESWSEGLERPKNKL